MSIDINTSTLTTIKLSFYHICNRKRIRCRKTKLKHLGQRHFDLFFFNFGRVCGAIVWRLFYDGNIFCGCCSVGHLFVVVVWLLVCKRMIFFFKPSGRIRYINTSKWIIRCIFLFFIDVKKAQIFLPIKKILTCINKLCWKLCKAQKFSCRKFYKGRPSTNLHWIRQSCHANVPEEGWR